MTSLPLVLDDDEPIGIILRAGRKMLRPAKIWAYCWFTDEAEGGARRGDLGPARPVLEYQPARSRASPQLPGDRGGAGTAAPRGRDQGEVADGRAHRLPCGRPKPHGRVRDPARALPG